MAESENKSPEPTNDEKIVTMEKLRKLLKGIILILSERVLLKTPQYLKRTFDIDKLENLPFDDQYLERFLYGSNFNVEVAFNKIKGCYELNLEHPNWFSTEGPLDKRTIIEKEIRILLPGHDKEGRIIYIIKLGNIDTKIMGWLDVLAVDDIWMESVLTRKPHATQKGVSVIVDVENYPWSILKWLTPEVIKISQRKLLTIPFKDIRFHFVNKSVVLHIAIKIMWPLLQASIKEMMNFHFDNWDSLYEHFEKEVLPPEYGGTYNVGYNELFEKLYERNDEILKYMKFYRNV